MDHLLIMLSSAKKCWKICWILQLPKKELFIFILRKNPCCFRVTFLESFLFLFGLFWKQIQFQSMKLMRFFHLTTWLISLKQWTHSVQLRNNTKFLFLHWRIGFPSHQTREQVIKYDKLFFLMNYYAALQRDQIHRDSVSEVCWQNFK